MAYFKNLGIKVIGLNKRRKAHKAFLDRIQELEKCSESEDFAIVAADGILIGNEKLDIPKGIEVYEDDGEWDEDDPWWEWFRRTHH